MKSSEQTTRIQNLRKEKKFTQHDVASQLGMHRTTYNKKENGETPFTLEELTHLADLLNVNVSFLQTGVRTENVEAHKDLGLSDRGIDNLRKIKYTSEVFDNPYPTDKMISDLLESPYLNEIHLWYCRCVQRREKYESKIITKDDRLEYFQRFFNPSDEDADAVKASIMRGHSDLKIAQRISDEYDFALFKLSELIVDAIRGENNGH